MDVLQFHRMFSDGRFFDLERMRGRYFEAAFREFVSLLNDVAYTDLPLRDALGRRFVYVRDKVGSCARGAKLLMSNAVSDSPYQAAAMAEEITASLALDGIGVPFESVRNILNGAAPSGHAENCAYGMKLALDFIADRANAITERNVEKPFRLLTLDQADKNELTELEMQAPRRGDSSGRNFLSGAHTQADYDKISDFFPSLIDFINSDSDIDELLKASAAHFFILQPRQLGRFSGPAARMIHLWALVRMGYPSALAVPLSRYVNAARAEYRDAAALALRNSELTGVVDVTPFLSFFAQKVYGKIEPQRVYSGSAERFAELMRNGKITTKERALWNFVLSYYGEEEFSTKTLERDFRDAAYATVRSFVVKFERLGLLTAVKYTNKSRYRAL